MTMLTSLQQKALIGYVAFFALMLNAMTQVDCCISSIAGEHGAPMAAAMDAGGSNHEDTAHHAHNEQVAGDAHSLPASGHSGHDAGTCECKDGMCGKSLVTLATLHNVGVSEAGLDEAWPNPVQQQQGHRAAKQFQIRAPPTIL